MYRAANATLAHFSRCHSVILKACGWGFSAVFKRANLKGHQSWVPFTHDFRIHTCCSTTLDS